MRSSQRRSGLFAGPRLDRLAVKFSAISVVVVAVSILVTPDPVAAQQPLAVYVGYMDTHTSSPTPNQPNPWPFTSPSNYSGSPCSGYPTSTTCWDASAIRLDNPNSSPVIGVHVVANIGGSIYDLWGSVTIPALGILVMTETGSQNSTNFDGSDYPPNAYNSGNFADCTNNGVIPVVSVTVGVSTTNYFDNTQVLNGGGHDAGHCVGSTYVSGRMDESHPWTLVSAPAQAGPTVTSLSPSSGSAVGGTQVTITGSGFTGVSQVAFSGVPASPFNFVSDSQVTAVAPAGTGTVDVSITAGGVTSPLNQPADQFTYISPPGAPTALTATAGNASISLSWTAPASNGGASITGYNVLRSTTSGAETALSSGVFGTAFTDSTVSNGTTYFYKVAAVNSVGPGPLSNEASATPATVPSAPQNLVASAGNGSVSLSWTAPASNGGAPVTSYNVLRSTTSGAETALSSGVTGTTYTDSSALNGTTYFYKVTAVNSAGPGAASNEASATPTAAPTVPSAPQNLTASAGNASVLLSWAAPASNGGAPVTSYNVLRSTSSGTESLLTSGVVGTSYTDSSALNGITYFYKVAAVNSVGPGPLSNEASATPATVPSAPQNLVASAGNGSVSLSWTAPASNGGAPVTSYNVLRSTTSGAETALSSGVTGTTYTDSSALNGTTYFYKVAAVNSAGPGPASNEASATPATVPSAPQTLVASAGNGSVSLSWTAPASNGGAPVTSYNVLRSTTSGAETALSSGVTGTTYTDSSALNGTTYFYKVTAVNSAGPGAASNEASATPTAAPTVPSAPQNLTASAGNASVLLSWAAPASNGGAPVTSYNVLRSTSSGTESLLTSGVVGTSYTDSSALNGITYFYKVAAVNSVGTGPLSNEASATPATVPSAPQNLVASAGNGSVSLSWTAPASNGGAAVTSYNVLRSTSSGAESSLSSGVVGTTFTDSTVSNGTTYFYKVAAVNSVGPGPLSNEASATPAPTVPTAPQNLVAVAGNSGVALSWAAPASNGGAPVTSYNVLRSTTTGTETLLSSGVVGTTFTDSTVSNGTTFFYKVAAVNSVGPGPLSNEASATPQVPPSAGFVRRIASATAAAGGTSIALTVGAPGVAAGDAVVVSVLLSSTSSITGALFATDTAGNLYTIARDVNDGSAGDRVVVLVALNVKALAATNQITLKVPSSGEIHASADVFAGVTGIDTSAGASASTTTFSAGPVTTSQTPEILVGAVGIESGSSPTWAAGWSPLPALAISSDYLDSAYQVVNTTGPFTATGTTRGTWMAAIVALKASGTPLPPPPTVPGAPTALTATAGNASISLSWTAPASNGGASITGYNVLRSTTSGAETALSSGVFGTAFTDSTVSNGTTYFYKVAAVNREGRGAG